jgi:hypothetical protein
MGFFGFASKDNRPVAGGEAPHIKGAKPEVTAVVSNGDAVHRAKRMERPARHVDHGAEGNPDQGPGRRRR